MKRRNLVIIAGASVLCCALAAGAFIIAKRPRSIVVALYSGNSWGVPQNFTYAIYDRAVELFETRSEHDDIRVVLKTGTMHKDYSEWFAQLVLKGREPDVFLIIEEDFSTYASIGFLENLDPYLQDAEGFRIEDFYIRALEAGRYEGRQYSLPISMVPSFLIVNKSLLSEYGLSIDEENWTWESFFDICSALTRDTDGDGVLDNFGVYGYDWHHAFYSNDTALFRDDRPEMIFDPDRLGETIDHLKALYKLNRGAIVTERDFARGNVGFKIFNLSEYRAYGTYPYRILKYENFEWDAIPFPKGPYGESASKLYTVQAGMSSRSRNKRVAADFIRFMASDEEYQLDVWKGTNTMPVLKSAVDTIYGDQYHQSEEIKTIGRDTLEDIIFHSYIDPNFKSYSAYDRMITQRIFQVVAQDQEASVSVKNLVREIEDFRPGD